MRTITTLLTLLSMFAGSASAQLEFGANDFRITTFGPDGTNAFGAIRPEIAYNSNADEYLVIFIANTDEGPTAPSEVELWGQRVGPDGSLLGGPTLLTDVGGIGAVGATPNFYRVIYVPSRNGYFVSYSAADPDFGDTTFRVYGLFLTAAGAPDGAAFQPTSGGTTVTNQRGEFSPDIVYNPVDDNILLAWERSTDAAEAAIFARLLSASDGSPESAEIQVDSVNVFSVDVAVAHNAADNEFLVHWRRGFGQSTMFQILDDAAQPQLMADRELASPGYFSGKSSVAFDTDAQQYLVVWVNSDPALGMVEGAYEIFGRRVTAGGDLLGTDKFRISQSDGLDTLAFGANVDCNNNNPCLGTARPGLDYSTFEDAFLVSWSSTLLQTDSNQAQTNQLDNLVRRIASGQDPDPASPQVQISNAGGQDLGFFAIHAVVAAGAGGRYLATWWGDDNRNGVSQSETEVWGQVLLADALRDIFADGFENPPPGR
ncbi:MAG: hypothetical protein AAF358_00065 [Pseudomonadota bacterium]